MALPEAPTDLVITPAVGTASVAFTQVDADPAITNYEYEITGSGVWVSIDPPDASSPITIAGLTEGTNYGVIIRAVNDEGVGTPSAQEFFDTLSIDHGSENPAPNPRLRYSGPKHNPRKRWDSFV